MKITGLEKITKTLKQAELAARELDGDLATLSYDPENATSVELAISEARLIVDNRLGSWYGNKIVDRMAEIAKAGFEQQVLAKVEEHQLTGNSFEHRTSNSFEEILTRVRDTIKDLRRADYQTFDRHAERLARLLADPVLALIIPELTTGLDLEAWLAAGRNSQGGMVGSAKLDWPEKEEMQLGYVILLASRFAGDSREALNFAHQFYYNGSKITPNLQHMVSQVFVPFERDFSAYVLRKTGKQATGLPVEKQNKYPRRVFIVHGHDVGAREMVARFMTDLQFDVVILHEQANRGKTIIEKFEEHADVGFVIVLLTPDDRGSALTSDVQQSRARQNVVLELGYFLGRLGRDRVIALRKGDVELPSDILGIVYTPFDENGGWRQGLAK